MRHREALESVPYPIILFAFALLFAAWSRFVFELLWCVVDPFAFFKIEHKPTTRYTPLPVRVSRILPATSLLTICCTQLPSILSEVRGNRH